MSNLMTYDEWEKALFIEDVEMTGYAVPRTTRQLGKLWDIYKEHNKSLYEIAHPRYSVFTWGQ